MGRLADQLWQQIEKNRVYARRLISLVQSRLWIRPALFCVLAIIAVWLCLLADYWPLPTYLPDISGDLIAELMGVLTASMLGVATFAVTSMVSAYNSVGSNATPRAFSLIVADDWSKQALSTFVAAFIFGTIGIIALRGQFYGLQGRLALFCLTLLVYGWVILTFVRWVDSIARLGRMGNAIEKVEQATSDALKNDIAYPFLGCAPPIVSFPHKRPIEARQTGYVQDVDVSKLQQIAENAATEIQIAARPGTFVGPGRALAWVREEQNGLSRDEVAAAFFIGNQRSYQSDPRFGFVVLSQIASRALSPGVNDPGTAIDVIGTETRLLQLWGEKRAETQQQTAERDPLYPAVRCAALQPAAFLGDAFHAISRDGAGQLEVIKRLLRCLHLLVQNDDPAIRQAALDASEHVLMRARDAMDFKPDLDIINREAKRVREEAARRKKLEKL